MKIIQSLFLISAFALTSIAIADEQPSTNDLSGTQLGVVRYYKNEKKKKKNKRSKFRAIRAYFNRIEGEADSYHAILLEYTNLLGMAPSYIGSNKLPLIQSIFGFLDKIAAKVTVYKVTPATESGTYDMRFLYAENGKLVTSNDENNSKLILSDRKDLVHPLSGATITLYARNKKGMDIDVFFPEVPKNETKEEAKARKKKDKFGLQYNLANFVYTKKDLDSTWRMNYLPGPYLRAYNDKKHKVLDLVKKGDELSAKFIIEPGSERRQRARQSRFTNPKSAFIAGEFTATQAAPGIFIFSSTGAEGKNQHHVENRIGLFIDIFDATRSLNQDVVELILVDSDNPTDFLMYYEHPDNGEGTESKEKKKK